VIVLDTNVISESARPLPNPLVVDWINSRDFDLRITTITLAEMAFGIQKTPEAERSKRLANFLEQTRKHFHGRIFSFDEEAAMIYGEIMGKASLNGRPMSIPDGMIAAIAIRHGATLATRNVKDFEFLKLKVVNPWA
jgi:predicted nucleic acid-binding protein